MTIHHFPGATDALDFCVRDASTDLSGWTGVVRALDALFPGAVFALRAEPHAAGASPRELKRDGHFRFARERFRSETRDWSPHSSGELVCPPRSADTAVPDAVLLLHRCDSCDWLLTVRLSEGHERRQNDAVSALLRRKAPLLVRAFRAFHAAHSGTRPSPADLEAVWDPLPYGVTLLTSALRPVAGNMAAEDILSTRSLFWPSAHPGRIRAALNGVQDAIEDAAARAEVANGHASVALPNRGRGAPMLLRLSALGLGPITGAPRLAPSNRDPRLLMTIRRADEVFLAPRMPTLAERAAPRLEIA